MHHIYTLLLTLVTIVCSSTAQNFSVPTSWLQTNTSLSYDQRVSLAQSAIDNTWRSLDFSTGIFSAQDNPDDPVLNGDPTADFNAGSFIWASIAFEDGVAGTTSNKASVINNLTLVAQINPHFNSTGFVSIPLKWGIASVFAYRAYNDTSMLDLAQDVWNFGSQFAISTNDALHGSQSSKNFTFHGTCAGVTTAGGVWAYQDLGDSTLDADTTSVFMLLSAYLSEALQNDTYTNAASLSANFLSHFFYSGGLIISNNMDVNNTCTAQTGQGLQQLPTAQYIEALSVLASQTNNATYLSILDATIAAATNQSDWQDGDGSLRGGDTKASLIRGLYAAFSRYPSNAPLHNLVRSYVNVQYNTLLDFATTPGSNAYAVNWQGPVQPYSTEGQRTALDLLVSAIGVNNNDTQASPSSSSTTGSPSTTSPSGISPTASHSKNSHVVGLAVGVSLGLVACFIVAASILLFRRKRNPTGLPVSEPFGMVTTPFVEHLSTGHDRPLSPRSPPGLPKGAMQVPRSNTSYQTDPSVRSGPEVTASTSSARNNGYLPAAGEQDNHSGAGPGLVDIPTQTLVRLLHQRLEQAGDGYSESPPSYVEG